MKSACDTIKTLKNEISSLKIKKSKLETDIKKLEKVISRKDSKTTKLGKQDNNQNYVKLEDSAASFPPSSLCSSTSRRSSATLTDSSPPFTSMISHWSPLPVIPPLMPNSITSMVTHYVSLRIDEKDDKEDFKVWMGEFREQLRIDRVKMIAEIRKDLSLLKLS